MPPRKSLIPFLLLVAACRPAGLPDDVSGLSRRGLALLEMGQPAAAAPLFADLSRRLATDPFGPANLAVAELRQGQLDSAQAHAQEALQRAPADARLWLLRGEIAVQRGDLATGFGDLTAVLAQPAVSPRELARALAVSEPLGAAGVAVATAARARLAVLRPENLHLLLGVGEQALAQGDRVAASGAYLRLRELLARPSPAVEAQLVAVLDALESVSGGDLAAATLASRRLANVLRPEPSYQDSLRELGPSDPGLPLDRLAGEPSPRRLGEPRQVAWSVVSLLAQPALAVVAGEVDGDDRADVLALTADGGVRWLPGAALGGAVPSPRDVIAAGSVSGPRGLLLADLDDDGLQDVVAWGANGVLVWQAVAGGSFRPAAGAWGLGGQPAAVVVAFDADLEGDLDLALLGAHSLLMRNDGSGHLTADTQALAGWNFAHATAAVASDVDLDGDPDLVVVSPGGVEIVANRRQGRFARLGPEAGLARATGGGAVVSADLDGDGRFDLAVAGGERVACWHNVGTGFAAAGDPAPPLNGGASPAALVVLDADADGRLELAAAGGGAGELALLRFESAENQAAPRRESLPGAATGARSLATADVDGDGDEDLLVAGGAGVQLLRNAGSDQRSLTVALRGLARGNGKNNHFGIGALLDVSAGRAFARREVTGPRTVIGLGTLPAADVLRVVWPNGVVQARLDVANRQSVVEEQVLKGSCPFLYTWDGSRMAFVTDLLWNGPLGLPLAPGVWAPADPRELVRVDGAVPRDGAYDLVVTEELWEAAFFDQVRLWVVDHPAAVEVASGLRVVPGGPENPERVLSTRELRPVAAAWDGQGRDVTARVARRDEVYADGYVVGRYQGMAPAWGFTFDLGAAPGAAVRLLLDGWIFPADASLNLALSARPELPYVPPRLEVETALGWQVLLPAMGFPAGKTKTMVVDTPPLPPGARRLRITSSLWLGWDRIVWSMQPVDDEAVVVARLAPSQADLGYRGFSRVARRSPNAPHAYSFDELLATAPWLPFPGHYTRYGDVRPLLAASDDLSVILAAGDGLRLRFAIADLPPLAAGWQRTVFLESDGWDKDADRNTWEAATVEPLPFHGMDGYPLAPYPDDEAHRTYRRDWLTRVVPVGGGGGLPAPTAGGW
jgi:tetratricopeptide (TPR) repeat protein